MSNVTDQTLNACYFPAFDRAEDIAFYQAQARWYLAPLQPRISVCFPEDQKSALEKSQAADIIFFWQKEAFWAAPASLRRKGLIVDEYAQQAVGDKLDHFVSEKRALDISAHSERFFETLGSKHPDCSAVLVIGSGPSSQALDTASKGNIENCVSLYLSTAILNQDICSAFPPGIIIAVDGPSQFGPSETAQRYRERAIHLIRTYDSLLLIPAQHLASVRTHWPSDIQDNVFAVPSIKQAKPGHSFHDDWQYEPTSNVLTSFGLPCASSLAKTIYFAGISFAPISERADSHWQHNDEADYQRHIAPMLSAHPAAGQATTTYVAQHLARLKSEIAAHSKRGIALKKWDGDEIFIAAETPAGIRSVSPWKIRFFDIVSQAEHHPGKVILTVFILAGLLGAALQYSIGFRMTGFLIAGALAATLIAGVFFLRLRQNRLAARLESKLSQQQAQQFTNLSERLDALERKK